MKNKIFILFLLLNLPQIYAQVSIGAFGILNSSNFSGNPPSGTEYTGRTALGGGIIADYKFNDEVTLSLQPMLLPKGTMVSYDLPSYEEQLDSVSVDLSYFSIPIVVKVSTGKLFYVSGGIQFDFLQNGKAIETNGNLETDIKNKLESYDIAANFGVGMQFKISSLNLFLEGRYSQGLINVSKFQNDSETNIVSQFKNTGIQLLAGILFPLGDK